MMLLWDLAHSVLVWVSTQKFWVSVYTTNSVYLCIHFQMEMVAIRGCIFFGFQFFVKNEEKDGFLHEERIIFEEKLNQK